MATEWVRYHRSDLVPLEAMYARFERHVYHRHSHDTYSFGVTESGAQRFACRGAWHTSAAGMVMTFNPDDPHDGRAAGADGFTYRMVHIGGDLLAEVATEALGLRPAGAPLFPVPVHEDPLAAGAVRWLDRALLGPATALRRDEAQAAAVAALCRLGGRPARLAPGAATGGPGARRLAARARDVLADHRTVDLGAAELAALTGHSRFAVYRAFQQVYGMAPSDYQRQLRLRTARDLLAGGAPPARAAAEAGFADQAHLTRWFVRCFGLTPGAFRAATGAAQPPRRFTSRSQR
jgi:AraC-like DNA-binding protein